jgi:hypothetical protein
MSYEFVRSLVLVTFGVFLVGHAAVRWARRRADAAELAPTVAIGCGIVAAGLALRAGDAAGGGVLLGALAVIVAGLIAVARRHSRTLSE